MVVADVLSDLVLLIGVAWISAGTYLVAGWQGLLVVVGGVMVMIARRIA